MMKKRLKTFTIMVVPLLLLAFSMASISQIYASTGQSQGVQGIPDNALQFNLTDLTPVCRMESITANKTHVYAYKNVTMMMNCSKNMGLNITIDPKVQTRYLALVMEQNQSGLLAMNISVSPQSNIRTMLRNLNFYWDIEPNDALQLRAQLRLHINGTTLNQELNRVVNASRLRWMYWNRSEKTWVSVESWIDEHGYLVCNTTHFSTWTVAEVLPIQVTGSLSKAEVSIGEIVTLSTVVKDEDGSLIEGATVEATMNGLIIQLTDKGSGTYEGTIDTSSLNEGTSNIIISAQNEGYIPNQYTLALTIQQTFQWMTYAVIGVAIVAVFGIAVLIRRR